MKVGAGTAAAGLPSKQPEAFLHPHWWLVRGWGAKFSKLRVTEDWQPLLSSRRNGRQSPGIKDITAGA